jgi:hypothetical protein
LERHDRYVMGIAEGLERIHAEENVLKIFIEVIYLLKMETFLQVRVFPMLVFMDHVKIMKIKALIKYMESYHMSHQKFYAVKIILLLLTSIHLELL